jgi:hypothetical protein
MGIGRRGGSELGPAKSVEQGFEIARSRINEAKVTLPGFDSADIL